MLTAPERCSRRPSRSRAAARVSRVQREHRPRGQSDRLGLPPSAGL